MITLDSLRGLVYSYMLCLPSAVQQPSAVPLRLRVTHPAAQHCLLSPWTQRHEGPECPGGSLDFQFNGAIVCLLEEAFLALELKPPGQQSLTS